MIIFNIPTINFPACWYCGNSLSNLTDIISTTYVTTNLTIECVIQVRRCQFQGDTPSCLINPIQNCLLVGRIRKCLKNEFISLECNGNDDRRFYENMTKVYQTIYKELKCMRTIKCSQIGINCWKKQFQEIDTKQNIESIPLIFLNMMDAYNNETYYPKFLEMVGNAEVSQKYMCW